MKREKFQRPYITETTTSYKPSIKGLRGINTEKIFLSICFLIKKLLKKDLCRQKVNQFIKEYIKSFSSYTYFILIFILLRAKTKRIYFKEYIVHKLISESKV